MSKEAWGKVLTEPLLVSQLQPVDVAAGSQLQDKRTRTCGARVLQGQNVPRSTGSGNLSQQVTKPVTTQLCSCVLTALPGVHEGCTDNYTPCHISQNCSEEPKL